MRFVKRPLEIEAEPVKQVVSRALNRNWESNPDWIQKAYAQGKLFIKNDGAEAETLEGRMKAGLEDWILLGVQGEIYFCRADIFRETYERVA